MDVIHTVEALREHRLAWRRDGKSVGLVPTMGALHEGHLALVHEARSRNDRVVGTIFVNPTQFGPNEDFASYPRNEEEDLAKFAVAGVDTAFVPPIEEMYPDDFSTTVSVRGLSDGLCGPFRPGHFDGMATVVTKMLLQALADCAYFGEKDFQQLQVIRRLARDLNIPTEIVGVPTVRERDGLALSSRNQYLDQVERRIAPELNRVLREIARGVAAGEITGSAASAWGRKELETVGFRKIDYVEVVDSETLTPVESLGGPTRVLAAAWLGRARLIDNVAIFE